jgi:hypothetical protein
VDRRSADRALRPESARLNHGHLSSQFFPGDCPIVASYPPLRIEDIRAATAYAAVLARERIGAPSG